MTFSRTARVRTIGLRALALPAVVLGSLVLSGCGGGDGLDRQPVTGSDAQQRPAGGDHPLLARSRRSGTDTSASIAGGKYAFTKETGPVPGTYAVAISSVEEQNLQTKEGMVPGAFRPPTSPDKVPAQYNSQTTLTATVKAGDSAAIDFTLTSGGDAKKK
ncbi:MAG: hypothetical protein U0835_16540 [Isosphaeraceae bacterium]